MVLASGTWAFLLSLVVVLLLAIRFLFAMLEFASQSANQTLFNAMLSAVPALFFPSGDLSVVNGGQERASALMSSGPLMQWKMGLNSSQSTRQVIIRLDAMVFCARLMWPVQMLILAPHKTDRHSLSASTMHSISSSIAGHFNCAVDDFLKKNATVLLLCLITAPSCKSDASVQMSRGTSGSGKASSTCSEMHCLMASKAVIEAGVGSSFPFA